MPTECLMHFVEGSTDRPLTQPVADCPARVLLEDAGLLGPTLTKKDVEAVIFRTTPYDSLDPKAHSLTRTLTLTLLTHRQLACP